MSGFPYNFKTMNAYELHKAVINTFVLQKRGDTSLLKRDTSKDKRDIDVIRENHKFLWNEEEPTTWEEKLAKKYFDKLFKEYCICDLSLYKENKVALRWRIDKEVVTGKGQFICGNKVCLEREDLRTWEVNFAYIENNEKKNALIKLRLCPVCSKKLNYRTKKREIKRLNKKSKFKSKTKLKEKDEDEGTSSKTEDVEPETSENKKDESLWSKPQEVTEKTREEEFEEYLEDLLL